MQRGMYVVRATSSKDKPSIYIANRWLTEAGFKIGTRVEVNYQRGVITITKSKEQSYEH